MSTDPTNLGLLVMAYGTASGPDDIERYYTDIRGGRRPEREHLEDLRRRYRAVGNRFPLDRTTRDQAAGIEAALREGGLDVRAYVGYKHSPPFLAATVERMRADGIEEAVGIVMAPHYSRMSIGSYIERVEKAAADGGPSFTFVEHWFDHPAYLDILSSRVAAARDRLTEKERDADLVLFTAHSLPERILEWNDPYPEELRETGRLVAERLGLERWDVAWQSPGRTDEPWLGPPLVDRIAEAAGLGHRAIVVCPCGFTADHLEILYDVDIEAQGAAREARVRLERTASMNADRDFVAAVARVVRDHVGRSVR